MDAAKSLKFGRFRLSPARRLLFRGEVPVKLSARALDILISLTAEAGRLVTKEQLVAAAWPKTSVHEANLRIQVGRLRNLLGDDREGNRYILSEAGRGYRFVAPIIALDEPTPGVFAPSLEADPVAEQRSYFLPPLLTTVFGRSGIVTALAAQLPKRRFITIVGLGGIGKTTVALATARELAVSQERDVCFIDFGLLADPLLVPSTLGFTLGVAIRSEHPVPDIIAFLRNKHILLILDSCENVVDAIAAVAEEVLSGAPRVQILATSREPLRAKGEWVQRLAPLAMPCVDSRITATEALNFPAIQLFVERAKARLDGFEMSDADAPVVTDICRGLDGVPLAIELAASWIDVLGVGGLAARLNDRFRLELRSRRRTALPRHQTLGATLDWSFETLPGRERVTLRRLSVFAGPFTLEAAEAIAADPDCTSSGVIDSMLDLVAKSLVVADIDGCDARYRLLDTVRVYALKKLNDSGEFEQFARRHAGYYLRLFEHAELERQSRRSTQWLATYGHQIDNVRSALDWAFSPRGDVALGVALTTAAVPLWTQLSLNEECRARVEMALDVLGPYTRQRARQEMQLLAALGGALMYTRGSVREMNAAWSTVLNIAKKNADIDHQLRALWGLCVDNINRGKFRTALGFAQKFRRAAASSVDVADPLIGERMIGLSLYFLGELTAARLHIERMIDQYVAPANGSHIVRYQFEQRVVARVTLAGILWLQGFPEQAMRMATENVDEANSLGHAISLTYAMAQSACPIALLTGDLAAAEKFVTMLLNQSSGHALQPWDQWGRCYKCLVLIKRGDLSTGVDNLTKALGELPENAFHMRRNAFSGELAEALSNSGEVGRGLATIEEALDQSQSHEEGWCVAELLRIKGEILLKAAGPKAAVLASQLFHQSLSVARRQEALSWELRAAMSFARLWRDQGRNKDARDVLGSVYGRFTEGFETTDLKMAKNLINELT